MGLFSRNDSAVTCTNCGGAKEKTSKRVQEQMRQAGKPALEIWCPVCDNDYPPCPHCGRSLRVVEQHSQSEAKKSLGLSAKDMALECPSCQMWRAPFGRCSVCDMILEPLDLDNRFLEVIQQELGESADNWIGCPSCEETN